MKKYLGLIYVGNVGTSWAYGNDVKSAAIKAEKLCRKDWGTTFTLPDELKVCVFDVTDERDWHCDYQGMKYSDTHEPMNPIEIVTI